MGIPSPQEAAPAYDDVFSDHPVNRYTPSGSASSYAAVPQDDDVELGHTHHNHEDSSSTPRAASTPPETLVQTIAGVFKPKPHTHCEQCDAQLVRRERLKAEKHCCNMVAATFMTFFVCSFIFGIIFTGVYFRRKRDHGH